MQDNPKNFGFKKPFPVIQFAGKMTATSIDWRVMQRNAQKDFDKLGIKRLTHS